MELDKSITQCGEKLDAWWKELSAMLDSADRVAQGNTLLRGFEIANELDRLKADGLRMIESLLNDGDRLPKIERVATLIRGFEFGARFADTLHDELKDTDGESRVWRLMDKIVQALNTIGPGRTALLMLLDNSDARVRSSAGAYLIDLMPERVVPMLREVKESENANSAHFNASWILLGWERERKSRFNYLSA